MVREHYEFQGISLSLSLSLSLRSLVRSPATRTSTTRAEKCAFIGGGAGEGTREAELLS